MIDRDTIAINNLLMPLDTIQGQTTDTLKLPSKLLLAHRSIVDQNISSVKGEAAKWTSKLGCLSLDDKTRSSSWLLAQAEAQADLDTTWYNEKEGNKSIVASL